MGEEVAAVGEGRRAQGGLGHDERRLEGILVAQEDLELEVGLGAAPNLLLLNVELHTRGERKARHSRTRRGLLQLWCRPPSCGGWT